MHEICLDTSAYLLPCDDVPNNGKHKRKLEDQRAIFKIKELAKEGIVKVFIPANVHIELRQHHDREKRSKADEFWKSVKPELIPQEIGFHGIQAVSAETKNIKPPSINMKLSLLSLEIRP